MLQARTAQGARGRLMREAPTFMKNGELRPLSLPLLQGPVLHWRNGQGRPPGYPAEDPDETAVDALPRAVSCLTLFENFGQPRADTYKDSTVPTHSATTRYKYVWGVQSVFRLPNPAC
jgi:hypothetical protein